MAGRRPDSEDSAAPARSLAEQEVLPVDPLSSLEASTEVNPGADPGCHPGVRVLVTQTDTFSIPRPSHV